MKNVITKNFTFTHIYLIFAILFIIINYSMYYAVTFSLNLPTKSCINPTFANQEVLNTYTTVTTLGHTVVAMSFLSLGDLVIPQLLKKDKMICPKLIHVSFLLLLLSFFLLTVGMIVSIELTSSEWTIYYPSESSWLEKKILSVRAVDFALASIYCFLSSLFFGVH